MAPPPQPCRTCGRGGPAFPLRLPPRPSVFAPDRPRWMSQLAETNFNKTCVADRVCTTCAGAAFCDHCCGEHHRGHDTAPAPADHAAATHRLDSFCTGCRVAFCSDLCAHHSAAGGDAHDVIPVVEHLSWYCARAAGAERWFLPLFDGVQCFRDEHRNILVPLHWKAGPLAEHPPWYYQLICADFSGTCATDRVCNTCGGAAFCQHCCGEHHRGHDTAAAATAEPEKPGAVRRRDSFCTACRVAFCSDLCAHHAAEGHEIIPIDVQDRWYCARCTGTEPWFLGLRSPQTSKGENGNVLVPIQEMKIEFPELGGEHYYRKQFPPWTWQFLTAKYSETCALDSVCNTCGGAAFCGHCCGEHHLGHDTAAAPAKEEDGSAAAYRRDSFCTACRVPFCSELCAHHAGHEVIRIYAYGDRHFVRADGSEPWFLRPAFGGIDSFEDKDGNVLSPLERKRSGSPEPGLRNRSKIAALFGVEAFEDKDGNVLSRKRSGSPEPGLRNRSKIAALFGVETFEDKDGNVLVPVEGHSKRSRSTVPGLRYLNATTPPIAANQLTPSATVGIETSEDKDGDLMVLQERKRRRYTTMERIAAKYLDENEMNEGEVR